MTSVEKKFDANKFFNENSLDVDDPATIYGSLHKLRRYLVNVDAVSAFRNAGGVTNLMILLKKYAVTLISLHSRNQQEIDAKLEKIVNETLSLTANCCHFDRRCKLIVKNVQFLSSLVSLLQVEKINLDIVASAVRLLGNLCDTKETAAAVLQTKSLVACVVHWMIKNDAKDDKYRLETRKKIRDLSLRTFRLASTCKTSFARCLLQNDVAFHVANFLSVDDDEQENSTLKEKIYSTLLEIAACNDTNFAEQFVRANVGERLVVDARTSKITRDLLFVVVRQFSDVRIDVSKYGAIEFVHELSRDGDVESTLLLSKFCRDAFTRVKLRETDALATLVDAFADDHFSNDAKKELMNAFICFLYDDNGILYLLKRRSTLFATFVDFLRTYKNYFSKCSAIHSTTLSEKFEEPPLLYRPDSPTYVKLRRNVDELDDVNNVPLCKEFVGRSGPSPFSPGPSWSPTHSTLSASPTWSLDSADISSSFSLNDDDDIDENERAERRRFTNSEWCVDDYVRTKSVDESTKKNSAADATTTCSYAESLCGCSWTPTTSDEMTTENLINSIVLFLSWLSHNDAYVDNLVSYDEGSLIETLIDYVGKVCRPQPKVGRLLGRLARNRLLTEKLLKLEFHLTVRRILCTAKCRTKPFCIYCRKLCRIGCAIITSFRTSGRKRKFLFEYNGLKTILNVLFARNDDNSTLNCKAFDAVRQLISPRRLKTIWERKIDRTSFPLAFPCEFSLKFAADLPMITFVSSSNDDLKINVNKNVLIEASSFYRAMFGGQFEESTKSILHWNDDETSFEALEIFVHFLHGCRQCTTCQKISTGRWRTVADLLSLADQHLRHDLYRYVVEFYVPKILDRFCCATFLATSVLRGDVDELFEICAVYVFLFGLVSEIFGDFLNSLNDDSRQRYLPSFKNLLEKFITQFV